jgi:hypothetical protein
MWIMTSWGVLMPGERPKEHTPAGDDRVIQIRARRRIDLERVCQFYPEVGLKTEDIIYFDFTDYEYRIFATRAQFSDLVGRIALDVNYVKFKSSTEKFKEHRLHVFYNRVWGIYYDMFSTNRYLEKISRSSGKKAKKKTASVVQKKHWWEDTDRVERTENF